MHALEQSNVKREFLLRLKQAFDRHAIQQPRNTMVVIDKVQQAERAPVPEGPPA